MSKNYKPSKVKSQEIARLARRISSDGLITLEELANQFDKRKANATIVMQKKSEFMVALKNIGVPVSYICVLTGENASYVYKALRNHKEPENITNEIDKIITEISLARGGAERALLHFARVSSKAEELLKQITKEINEKDEL